MAKHMVAKCPGLTGTVPEFGPLSWLCPGHHLCPGMLKIFTYLELRVAKTVAAPRKTQKVCQK